MKPAKHGRDHKRGGEDPVPFDLPYIIVSNGGTNQTVTGNTELLFTAVVASNDATVFEWNSTDPSGVLIHETGLYIFFADVSVLAGSVAIPRSVVNGLALNSSGPLASLGSEAGEGIFAFGTGQGASGVSEVDTIAKSRLLHTAIVPVTSGGIIEVNPFRAVVNLMHPAGDYTVGNIASALTIVRFSAGNTPFT